MDEWDLWQARLIERVRTHPPRCLVDVRAISSSSESWTGVVQWSIGCACGADTGRVYGHPLSELNSSYSGPELYVSPLFFECASCQRRVGLIDTSEHGHDAELARRSGGGYRGASIRGEGLGGAVPCPECGNTEHGVDTFYSHPHFDIIEDEPDWEPLTQDFFDGYGCRGTCRACKHQWTISSFELA